MWWWFTAMVLGCSGTEQSVSAQRDVGPLVLMVSWDTTRADALGCYADENHWGLTLPASERPSPSTPVADRLAERGTRARWALAHAPTTLNSHTSVFSGRDPHAHAVPRNGFPVPDDVPLLAEVLQADGWDTIAVVGASVLERDMGLDRGFRVYDDAVGTRVRRRYEDPAERVVARALAAVDGRSAVGEPLFLFVHFFDAHSPWNSRRVGDGSSGLGGAYKGSMDGGGDAIGRAIRDLREGRLGVADRRRLRELYLDEVSYVDEQLGVLLNALAARGYARDQLVVLFGDHGETLDEVPERGYQHGVDVELVNLHVPLIFAGAGRFGIPEGVVLDQVISLRDITPTVLRLVGSDKQLGDGGMVLPLSSAESAPIAPTELHFAEATKPSQPEASQDWNNIGLARAVVAEGMMLRTRPFLGETAQLFLLDAGQPRHTDEEAQARLTKALANWDAQAPEHRSQKIDQNTHDALKALGYLDK